MVEDAREDWLLARLRALVEVREFASLRTESQMLSFALDRIPELREIEKDALWFEIRELKCSRNAGYD